MWPMAAPVFDTLRIQLGYFSGFSLPAGTVINLTMGPGGAASVMQFNGIITVAISNIEKLIYFGVNATDSITGGAAGDLISGRRR